ncbi:cellulose synthase catalytic subunit [Dactylosporangium sp. NPDC005572]|uniref:glycosyltransferase family 2 protein n=1 Tax=Dactylosporangium sp. NPDC005572 TaxID=3156889 RepID=UPI0033A29D44
MRRASKPEPYLPEPPGRNEKFLYYGAQSRGVFAFSVASFLGVAYGLVQLALNNWWTAGLFIVVGFLTVTVGVSIVSSTRRRRSNIDEHRERVANWRPPDELPTVDVFVMTAGEPMHVLRNTIMHAATLDWPADRLTVYVCDDSGRASVRWLAERYHAVYLCRPDRGRMKKAGNLKHAFEHSDGDFIHVFDADFAARSDMTREMLPYFDDPATGIVQTPQYFDVAHPRFNWLQRAAAATQELFYRWIQPARDGVDAAICVGTNALYRRTALQKSGGFAQIGHSEDVWTGVRLKLAGFGTRYVPVILAKGMCPDNLDGFANQQYRWCTGSMSLLADREFHRTRALSRRQKLCFWTGFLYYIATAVTTFTGPVPLLLMVWWFPDQIRPMNYFSLAGTVLVWLVVMPLLTDGRWTPVVLRVQALIGFCHAVAIWDALRGRTAGWVATGAARHTPTARRVLRLVRWWVLPTQLAVWAGIGWGVAAHDWRDYWVTVLFALPAAWFLLPLTLGRYALPAADPDPDPEPADRTVVTSAEEVLAAARRARLAARVTV